MSKLKRAQKYIGKKIQDPYSVFRFLVQSVVFKNEREEGFYFKGRHLNEDGTLHSQEETIKEKLKERQEKLDNILSDPDLILKEIDRLTEVLSHSVDLNELIRRHNGTIERLKEVLLLKETMGEEYESVYMKINSRCRHEILE